MLLCAALLLDSCVKQIPVSDQAEKVLVVNAYLETGSPIYQVGLSTLDTGDGMQGISGLEVSISDGDHLFQLTESEEIPGRYQGDASFIIEPSRTYNLSLDWNGAQVTAQTKSTPALMNLDVSKQFLDVEQDNDLVFLEWDGVNQGSFNEYFYLVTVRPLVSNDNLESINRSNGATPSSRAIGLTYNPELTLIDDYFLFYGEHLVEVLAIHKNHEDYFRAQMDYSLNAPGNVNGAAGFFVGTSVLSTVIDIR